MIITTSDIKLIKNLFKRFILPLKNSHKGDNGKVLIIGGSSLFHAASIWAAEVCSYFADIVHYSSTIENEKIFIKLKKIFRNGIVISRNDLDFYLREDDVILVGPGMLRKFKIQNSKFKIDKLEKILKINDEGEYTYYLTKYLIENFPEKKFVFDAGALQMMQKEWLIKLKQSPIITPHQVEFEGLFNVSIRQKSQEEKAVIVKEMAKKYKITILLKAIDDIVSDGEKIYVIRGGNAGLTKGGTGDVLAGVATSFFVKNSSLEAALFSSLLLKLTAERLFKDFGYWYNVSEIIKTIPKLLKENLNL